MIINVKVILNAKKTEITESGGVLKIKLTAPPKEGKANKELLKILSRHFKVSKNKIKIVKGERSRIKTVEIG